MTPRRIEDILSNGDDRPPRRRGGPQVPLRSILKHFRSSILLILLAVFLLAVTLLVTVRIGRISGTEIGIKVNNLTGHIQVIPQSGAQIYNGLLSSFHVLDKTVQRLEMTATSDRGDRRGKDDLRIKTVDGSDVYLDLTINYKILPEMTETIVRTSGLQNAYKIKWVRDYSRSVCRTVFGELTTEQFYDASQLDGKKIKAAQELNTLLNPYGIEVTSVIAEKFRFHPEYEEKIKEKKLADQEVEEQISRANSARENQKYRRVEATKKKEVAIAAYKGEMEKLVVEATAQAERIIKEAQAYAVRARKGAEAEYYQKEQNAAAILAQRKAEAEGLKKMAEALTGQGGRNIVKMEYVTRLNNMNITGQPYTVEGRTERFSHIEEGATRRAAPKP